MGCRQSPTLTSRFARFARRGRYAAKLAGVPALLASSACLSVAEAPADEAAGIGASQQPLTLSRFSAGRLDTAAAVPVIERASTSVAIEPYAVAVEVRPGIDIASPPVIRQALINARRIEGSITCGPSRTATGDMGLHLEGDGVDYGWTPVAPDGRFALDTAYFGGDLRATLYYEAEIRGTSSNVNADVSTPLRLMDWRFGTRSDEQTVPEGTITNGVMNLNTIHVPADDCEIWRQATVVLRDYHLVTNASPPAGQLRIKRFSSLTPHAFYDLITLPDDFLSRGGLGTMFHEFGHAVRHAADGDEAHWHGDNFAYAYARDHSDRSQIFNAQYTFNEGWGNYWRAARLEGRRSLDTFKLDAGKRDWNENMVGNRLLELAGMLALDPACNANPALAHGCADRIMVEVLTTHPGSIHSLFEFESALAEQMGWNTFPHPEDCPTDYADDGATCRKDGVVRAKPSQPRGAGLPPDECGSGQELYAGLCYPLCQDSWQTHWLAPYRCYEPCAEGYADDGFTCRRDAEIISADNSQCPGYDLCGLTFAQGCSNCPNGYQNDGCTCRVDVHVYSKDSYDRGAGSAPSACSGGRHYDSGLCYAPCAPPLDVAGGPVCYGHCPAPTVSEPWQDRGAVCAIDTSILIQ